MCQGSGIQAELRIPAEFPALCSVVPARDLPREILIHLQALSARWDVEKGFLGNFRRLFLGFGQRNCLAPARFCSWQAPGRCWLCLIPALRIPRKRGTG